MDETWIVYERSPRDFVYWVEDLGKEVGCKSRTIEVQRLDLPNRCNAEHAAILIHPETRMKVLLALVEELPGGLRIEIVTDPTIDGLTTDEMRSRFGKEFRYRVGAGGRRTGLLMRLNGRRAEHCGRTILSCNVWLEEKLTFVDDPAERKRLMTPWLKKYREAFGVDPADPSRSFRKAVEGCTKRLAQRAVAAR